MNARRRLQKFIGVLSIIAIIIVIWAAACVALAILFPNLTLLAKGYEIVKEGFQIAANLMGIGDLMLLLPAIAYVLPALLLVIPAIVSFLPENGKPGKYTVANVFALIAIIIMAGFTLVFATDLAVNVHKHTWYLTPFSWTTIDTIVRYIALGLLFLFVLCISIALATRPKARKEEEDSEEPVASTTEDVAEESGGDVVVVESADEVPTEYVPETTSVADVEDGLYGDEVITDPIALERIRKARYLYDLNAISREEFIKVVNSCLRQ